jgi:hypothetical protein
MNHGVFWPTTIHGPSPRAGVAADAIQRVAAMIVEHNPQEMEKWGF